MYLSGCLVFGGITSLNSSLQRKAHFQQRLWTCSFSLNSDKMWWYLICCSAQGSIVTFQDHRRLTLDAMSRTPKVMKCDWKAGNGGAVLHALDLVAKIPFPSVEVGSGSSKLPSVLLSCVMRICSQRDLFICGNRRLNSLCSSCIMPLPDSVLLKSINFMSCSERNINLQMLLAHFFRYLSSSIKPLHELICRMCQIQYISSYDLWFHHFPFSTKNAQV